MKVKVNDTFISGEQRFTELLTSSSDPEPEYQPPKKWPHQVPADRRIR